MPELGQIRMPRKECLPFNRTGTVFGWGQFPENRGRMFVLPLFPAHYLVNPQVDPQQKQDTLQIINLNFAAAETTKWSVIPVSHTQAYCT